MRSLITILLAGVLLAPPSAVAQSEAAVPSLGDSASLPKAPVKKKGLFGKVKGLAKNKVVKTVAKAALCTAVPGGQVIAGALDAAEAKDVAGAATGAATGGSGCIPGMGGMAGAPAVPGLGGVAAGALGAGVSPAALPGQPSSGMPALTMTPEQLKQMQEHYGKMGMDTAQLRAMQQMMAGMQGTQPVAAAAPVEAPAGAPTISREKGRLVVRQLPWAPGTASRLQGGELKFAMAVHEVALALEPATKKYRIEARVEDQGNKAGSRALARQRAEAIVAALTAEGIPSARLSVADGKGDRDPRIIVSETK